VFRSLRRDIAQIKPLEVRREMIAHLNGRLKKEKLDRPREKEQGSHLVREGRSYALQVLSILGYEEACCVLH
jgi:hypothetical protein